MGLQTGMNEVSVLDGGSPIETVACRGMNLPDGRLGVLWRGQVFPLLPGDRINISGEFCTPEECSRLPTANAVSGYMLSEGTEEALVLIGGNVFERDLMATKL